jgi:hypothetical protein
MSLVRVLLGTGLVVRHTFYVDETPTDATGSVTWTLARLDGTSVGSGSATHPGPAGVYEVSIGAQAQLDALVLTWSATVAAVPVVSTDVIEVVGGYLFGLAEARALPPALSLTKYPTATLAAKRTGVEVECEEICGQAFVPRFGRVALSATGTNPWVVLPRTNIRAIRSIKVGGTTVTGYDFTPHGTVYSGGAAWTWGRGNIIVEFEYGMAYPPVDLAEAAMLRLRTRLTLTDSGVPQNALSFSIGDGGVYRLATPSAQATGVPDVDGAYARYTPVVAGFA